MNESVNFFTRAVFYFDFNSIHKKIGFISYGSGSKAKIFEGTVQNNWKDRIGRINLFQNLDSRKKISINIYEQLHKRRVSSNINNNQGIIHGFLIGSLAVRLIRTFVVLDVLGAQKPYNVFQRRDEENNASSANLSWKQRKANYASIRSKAKEEVTYNFQSSGVQRHDLI